jgi:hypothetical protein
MALKRIKGVVIARLPEELLQALRNRRSHVSVNKKAYNRTAEKLRLRREHV